MFAEIFFSFVYKNESSIWLFIYVFLYISSFVFIGKYILTYLLEMRANFNLLTNDMF